jgi:hypothetical protein
MELPKAVINQIKKVASLYSKIRTEDRELNLLLEHIGVDYDQDFFDFYYSFLQDGSSKEFINYLKEL